MRIDGDTLEDFYERTHLDETRRKFLDALREGQEGRDITPVNEKYPIMKKEISWLAKKREIRPDSSLRI